MDSLKHLQNYGVPIQGDIKHKCVVFRFDHKNFEHVITKLEKDLIHIHAIFCDEVTCSGDQAIGLDVFHQQADAAWVPVEQILRTVQYAGENYIDVLLPGHSTEIKRLFLSDDSAKEYILKYYPTLNSHMCEDGVASNALGMWTLTTDLDKKGQPKCPLGWLLLQQSKHGKPVGFEYSNEIEGGSAGYKLTQMEYKKLLRTVKLALGDPRPMVSFPKLKFKGIQTSDGKDWFLLAKFTIFYSSIK